MTLNRTTISARAIQSLILPLPDISLYTAIAFNSFFPYKKEYNKIYKYNFCKHTKYFLEYHRHPWLTKIVSKWQNVCCDVTQSIVTDILPLSSSTTRLNISGSAPFSQNTLSHYSDCKDKNWIFPTRTCISIYWL